MKEEQNDLCYLCSSEGFRIGKNNHTEKLAVDHDHKTNRIRRLLCHNCNRALGLLKDDPDLMRRAADYVEFFSESATTISEESTPKRVEAVDVLTRDDDMVCSAQECAAGESRVLFCEQC